MSLLLITPPLLQVNTAYPAMPMLSGYLQSRAYQNITLADLSIEWVLEIFSRACLEEVETHFRQASKISPKSPQHFFLNHARQYQMTIEPVIQFLQGKNPSLAARINSGNFLPEGARFAALQDQSLQEWAFGALSLQDQAMHRASLYLDDLADILKAGVDPHFAFSRYAERLAASQADFTPLYKELLGPENILVQRLRKIVEKKITEHQPNVVGITAPFPGNVWSAFKIAQIIKEKRPQARLVLGGGYVNTELRQLSDPRVFEFFDFLTFDDGEKPFECILEYLAGKRPLAQLKRTLHCHGGQVQRIDNHFEKDPPMRDRGLPDFKSSPWDLYFNTFEMLNPVNRLWSDGKWLKMTVAHGCYWKKCSFCDLSLNYINHYDPMKAELLVDQMQTLMQETGQSGFHFVDEAAPPQALRRIAEIIIERKLTLTWWGNIRFEKNFTAELADLLARSGCIALTGGLEVASPRILKLINKGVSIEQVARVTRDLSDAGILVHAYLMYGFPSQTEQETIDSLEVVRQLFKNNCIQSAFWHRFSATAHSPVGQNPKKYGIDLKKSRQPQRLFAVNDLEFSDRSVTGKKSDPHVALGEGLKKALYNYMHGIALEEKPQFWFKKKVKASRLHPDFIARALE